MFIDTEPTTRGKVIAILVMPSGLLMAEGLLTAIGGFLMFVFGMWQVINAMPLNIEGMVMMFLGSLVLGWGAVVCYGACKMQDLSSYRWAVAGAVLGLVPFLVGGYVLLVLKMPDVKAAFEEVAAGIEDDDVF